MNSRPWILSLQRDLKIAISQNGSGALIYYQGYSEPETADFVTRFLKPGMTFLDIGAHMGEYTLLASRAVGPQGEVHVFEPNRDIFQLLRSNVHMNNLGNVVLNNCCVSDLDGERELEVYAESTISSLRLGVNTPPIRNQKLLKVINVVSTCLDTYWPEHRKRIYLVKIDVEGAELLVLRGAMRLISLPGNETPIWLFEYRSGSYDRFGYHHRDLLAFFKEYDYEILHYEGADRFIPVNMDFIPMNSVNLIAVKNRALLGSI